MSKLPNRTEVIELECWLNEMLKNVQMNTKLHFKEIID